MDKKAIPTNTVTRALREIDSETNNIYKSVSIISQRADQLSNERREEITNRLADFVSTTDSLEETFENREQIEMSRYFERLPKPTLIATEEFLANKIDYHMKSEEPKIELQEEPENVDPKE